MIEVSIKDFSKAVQIAGAAHDTRNTIPVLGAMKLRANGKLELQSTDLDMTATVAVPCQTAKEAEFLLTDPRAVVSAVGAAGGANVTFAATDSGFVASAGKLRRETSHGMPVEDWPENQAQIAERTFGATLSADTLRQIERVTAAISKEETRYYLNGINLKRLEDAPNPWTYRFAATDGHRLMVVDVPLPDADGELAGDVILPRSFVQAVLTHLRKAEGPLRLELGLGVKRNSTSDTAPAPASITRVALAGRVGNADVHFASKVIDGKYPDYNRVIPTAGEKQALFPVAELRRAIQAVSSGRSELGAPAISLTFEAGGVVLGMAYGVTGVSASYRLDCEHNVPVGGGIGFKAAYLLDILNAVQGDETTFAFENEASPCLIRDTSDPAFVAVLMPMRLPDARKKK